MKKITNYLWVLLSTTIVLGSLACSSHNDDVTIEMGKPKATPLKTDVEGNIKLNIGEKKDINIISGSGEYDLHFSEGIAAMLQDKKISVEAKRAGEQTLTLTDKKTKEKAIFKITVQALELEVSLQKDKWYFPEVDYTLTITSGNGKYEVTPSDKKVACTAVPDKPNEYKIRTNTKGDYTISVKDKESGKTIKVDFKVVDKLKLKDHQNNQIIESDVTISGLQPILGRVLEITSGNPQKLPGKNRYKYEVKLTQDSDTEDGNITYPNIGTKDLIPFVEDDKFTVTFKKNDATLKVIVSDTSGQSITLTFRSNSKK